MTNIPLSVNEWDKNEPCTRTSGYRQVYGGIRHFPGSSQLFNDSRVPQKVFRDISIRRGKEKDSSRGRTYW